MKPQFPEWISVKGEVHWSGLVQGQSTRKEKNSHALVDSYIIKHLKQSLRAFASHFNSLNQENWGLRSHLLAFDGND